MQLWQTNPFQSVTLVEGEGCTVRDTAGKTYLDMLAGTWCNVLGYGHPRWVEAVRDQVSRITHTGAAFVTPPVGDGLSKLSEILPPQLDRLVFLNTGSEAVELALQMARAASGANDLVVVERGYYGATTYALGLSEAGRTAAYLPSLGHLYRLAAPDCLHCPARSERPCRFPCLDPLAEWVEQKNKSIAGVLYEPVMGRGILVPPVGYGARLRALTSSGGVLLIAEEVTTGMGRTGRWFAFQHENIVPDILVLGKAIGAGLPIAAVVTTADVERRCQGTLSHIQSHQNDPLSGRIAATVVSILQEEHLVEQADERGRYLLTGLEELRRHNRCIADVRGRGAMVGVELQPEWSNQGPHIARRLLELGFIVDYQVPTSTFRLFPPFVISTQEIDAFLQAFRLVLDRMQEHGAT